MLSLIINVFGILCLAGPVIKKTEPYSCYFQLEYENTTYLRFGRFDFIVDSDYFVSQYTDYHATRNTQQNFGMTLTCQTQSYSRKQTNVSNTVIDSKTKIIHQTHS